MPINFDSAEFKKNLREQFEYIMKYESRELLEDALNELVRERLEKLAHQELDILGQGAPDIMSDPAGALSRVHLHLSPLDIDHRELVKGVLRTEMKKLLRDYVEENIT